MEIFNESIKDINISNHKIAMVNHSRVGNDKKKVNASPSTFLLLI